MAGRRRESAGCARVYAVQEDDDDDTGMHAVGRSRRRRGGGVVRRAGIDEVDAWAALACSVFGFDENMHSILRATFGGDSWQHWLATIDADIAGVAATHLVDETAWIGWVCTAPRFRGRGIQRQITAAQLAGARDAGARWVTLEAATGSPTRPGASLRNYRRMEFQAVHERLTYLHRSAL